MNYTGQFKNINNTLYQIDIDVNNGVTGSTEIVLAGEPFKVEYNSNGTIYEPLKLSNATCSILSSSYMFDIYSSTAQGTKLTLKNVDTNSVEWVGYVTPNIYTQGFETTIEQIDLEAIDGLSTLENYNYNQIDSDNKKIKSFENILIHLISKCNCYNHIYVNQNNSLISSIDKLKIIDKLFISEQNFYNDDATYTTVDTSMTNKEVLTEMLQYLGYTIVAYGDSVYLLDYDYIKNGYTNYTVYSTSNNWSTYTTGTIILNDIHSITSDSFKSNGGTIELDTTYNQIAIKTSVYKNESLLPDFFDDKLLSNILTTGGGDWNAHQGFQNLTYSYYYKFYNNNKFQNLYYTKAGVPLSNTTLDYNFLCNNVGSAFLRTASYISNETPDTVSLSYTDYILLFRHLEKNPTSTTNYSKPILKLNPVAIPETSYGYDNYFLVLTGGAYWTKNDGSAFIDVTSKDTDSGDYVNDDIDFSQDELFLEAKLKIGNKYWNGSKWQSVDVNFKIYFDAPGYSKIYVYYNWYNTKNNVNIADNINLLGQSIPIKKSDKLVGDVDFQIMTPCNVVPDSRVDCVWLKDFKIQLVKPNINKDQTTDTEYKNVINLDYVNEFSGLTFKVCSDTNKGLNYSSVIDPDNIFVATVTNKSLNKDQLQEHNIIEKYVNQYSTPRKILNLTLENCYYPYTLFDCALFSTDKYIVSKMSIDYFNNNNTLTIVEKI